MYFKMRMAHWYKTTQLLKVTFCIIQMLSVSLVNCKLWTVFWKCALKWAIRASIKSWCHNNTVKVLHNVSSTDVVAKTPAEHNVGMWWAGPAQACESWPLRADYAILVRGALKETGTEMEHSDRGRALPPKVKYCTDGHGEKNIGL